MVLNMQVYMYMVYDNSRWNYLSNEDPVSTIINILISSIECVLIYAV